MTWPDVFAYNFCPNPSVELGTDGYAPLIGHEQLAQASDTFSGQFGLRVDTPGLRPGEGVITPVGSILADATGSASCYILGDEGLLTIQAVQNGGQILGTFQVELDGTGWKRVELNGLAMLADCEFQLLIFTTLARELRFFIDACHYGPDPICPPYFDGDWLFCEWFGLPHRSPCFRRFGHPISANGGMLLEGDATPINVGQVFSITGPVAGAMDMSGLLHPMVAETELIDGAIRPVIAPAIDTGVIGLPWEIAGGGTIAVEGIATSAGFGDFGIWETGVDPDPAKTLIGGNNAGIASGATGYNKVFGTFSPPRQALDSAGAALWHSAAYMAAGFRIVSQATFSSGTPNAVNFTQVQVEKGTAPTTYQLPRALLTIVKPSNLNYVTNPSFEVSLAGWTAVSGATLTKVSGGVDGSFMLQVSVPSAGGGVSISVPSLILGDMFTASASVEPVSVNITDIQLSAGGAQVSANPTGFPYGDGGFGSGPYGGVNPTSSAMDTGAWGRPWTPFQAPASTVTLSLIPVAITGATYPLVFNVDAVMVAPGEALTAYGDGSSDGWQWELGGTSGLSRSYYYERESVGASAVQSVLDQHIPLGISAYAPQFAVAPTQ